ncbi:MAG: hypothetical protein NZ805_08870 [Armatimonadetes bacterium]|nr:hypothetical protein [Armatimonadota bacterium]MDW8028218.1 hypothetical protein [Armatimonadota bacterium]
MTIFGAWLIVAFAFMLIGLRPSALIQAAQVLGIFALLIAAFRLAILSLIVVTAQWH